jgi:hypothetical protein
MRLHPLTAPVAAVRPGSPASAQPNPPGPPAAGDDRLPEIELDSVTIECVPLGTLPRAPELTTWRADTMGRCGGRHAQRQRREPESR